MTVTIIRHGFSHYHSCLRSHDLTQLMTQYEMFSWDVLSIVCRRTIHQRLFHPKQVLTQNVTFSLGEQKEVPHLTRVMTQEVMFLRDVLNIANKKTAHLRHISPVAVLCVKIVIDLLLSV